MIASVLPAYNLSPRDPGSPSENGFMEPKYYAEEVIGHLNHHLRI